MTRVFLAGRLSYDALVLKRTFFCFLAACAITVVLRPAAFAKENGFPAEGCAGCHKGGDAFKPKVTFDPPVIQPGQSVEVSVHIPAVNGPAGGIYLNANNKGVFTEIPGGGLKKITNTQATHTSPKAPDGNEIVFRIRWTAPADRGGVEFDALTVSANRNGGTGGDSEGFIRQNFSYGCEGVDGYLDQDGDGWGIPDLRGPTRFCELPPNYTLKSGDCNDYDRRANPMGIEICNAYDDDCDGQINEGLEGITVYRDEDGDGYGARIGESKMGCGSGFGWSSTRDDCDDANRDIHPNLKETCNQRDDDCNGRVDDGARASCGQGWCRRLSPTCDPAACMPGPPRAESCNAFDDDCDGDLDNGMNLCPEGRSCRNGFCLTQQEAAEVAASKGDAGTGNADGGAPAGGGPTSGPSSGPSGNRPPEMLEAPRPKLGCEMGGVGEAGSLVAVAVGIVLLRLLRARRRRGRASSGA
jgi:hypothetical protein